MSAAAHLVVSHLDVDFGGRRVLTGVDLVAQSGLVAVLGPNGSGKSSLLRCIATIVTPTSGALRIDGLDPAHETDRAEIRRRLGYLPQEPGLSPRARVFDVVEYLAVCKGMRDPRRRRAAVGQVLDRVGLVDRAGDRVGSLSGGMRRRVGLAQALLGNPSLLVLDEPSVALDPDERARLRLIVSEHRTASTVVLATHLTDDAAFADQVVVLVDGAVRFLGSPAALAALAQGRVWRQHAPVPLGVRSSVVLADGVYRCVGDAPPGAELVDPTLEDGWLIVTSPGARVR